MSDAQKPWERVAHGAMNIFGPSVEKAATVAAQPLVDKIDDFAEKQAAQRAEDKSQQSQQARDEDMKAAFKEAEWTRLHFEQQGRELQELATAEAYKAADAAAKEQQLKDLLDAQNAKTERFLDEQQARMSPAALDAITDVHAAQLGKQQEERREVALDMERQKADEQRAIEAQREQRRQETEFTKPAFEDVERAEALRRASELQKLDQEQQKTLEDARAAVDAAVAKGMEQADADRRVAELAERLAAEREAMIKEQQERMNRFEQLYDRDR